MTWPDALAEGLARDILAFVEPPPQVASLNLVDRIDLASASLEELRAIHDTADMVGGVAYATAWQGRCQVRSRRSGTSSLNPAGALMHWLGDALTEIETAAIDEARQREPKSDDDRSVRLLLIAPTTIENGEPGEMAEVVREMIALSETEA